MIGKLHAPAALSQMKNSRYPLEIRLGGPQRRLDAMEKCKTLEPTGTLIRTFSRPARTITNTDCATAAVCIT
jgi:hypothetical protein